MGNQLMETTERRNPDAEITNPHTKDVILRALRGEDSIAYEYDKESGRLYIYLVS